MVTEAVLGPRAQPSGATQWHLHSLGAVEPVDEAAVLAVVHREARRPVGIGAGHGQQIHLPRGCACRSPKRHRCQSGEAADGKQDMQAGREGQGKISHSYAHRLFWPFRDEKGMARNSSPVTSTPLVISPCHCPIMYLVPLSGHNYASLPPTYLCALWTTRDSHMPADIYIYGWAKEDVRQIQYFCFWFWP